MRHYSSPLITWALLIFSVSVSESGISESVSYLTLTRHDQVSFQTSPMESKAIYLGRNESGGYRYALKKCLGGMLVKVAKDDKNYNFEFKTRELGSSSTIYSSNDYQEPDAFGKSLCSRYVSNITSDVAKRIESRLYLQTEIQDLPSYPYQVKTCFFVNVPLSLMESVSSDGIIDQVDEVRDVVPCY